MSIPAIRVLISSLVGQVTSLLSSCNISILGYPQLLLSLIGISFHTTKQLLFPLLQLILHAWSCQKATPQIPQGVVGTSLTGLCQHWLFSVGGQGVPICETFLHGALHCLHDSNSASLPVIMTLVIMIDKYVCTCDIGPGKWIIQR